MPNTMPEDSETECVDTDSQRPGIRTCDQSSTSREIRNDPQNCHESAFAGLSSVMEKNEAFSCGNEEEKGKTRFSGDECARPEIGCSSIREYDYIGFKSEAATIGNKSKEENCIKLGPKTKETELRLGLPEDDELDGGADVAGSRRTPDAKSLTIEVTEPPRLDLSSVHRGKADEYGPQRDSILERESRYVNSQEISGYNSFIFAKKGSNPVDEAGQAKLNDVSPVELPSSLKDLRLPLHPGAYDSRFIQSGEAQKCWMNSFNSREFSQVVQDYNYRALHAASKGIASGAKRGFSDALGVNLMRDSGFGLPESDSKLLNQSQPRNFIFPWAVPQQYGPANAWLTWEQKSKQNLQHYSKALAPSGIPDDKTNNRFGEGAISTQNTQSVVKASQESQRPPAPVAASEKIQTPAETDRAPNQSGTPSRAPPVVGWPPIRSFRKNLAAQPKVAAAPSCNPPPPPAADPGEKKINTMFVKVNVDGVPIGRKIDLKAYDSYEKLTVALDEMFRVAINAQTSDANPLPENNNNQASLLNGRDYVFVYEDNEGDRMLVGDVPWDMFVKSVKRLRVMKSSDVRRLAANRTQ